MCQSLFLIKLQALSQQLYQKETLVKLFSCEFCEIFKNTFFKRIAPVAASVSFYITPENIGKLLFLVFLGGIERE